jgi:hypothetical protein
MAEYNLSFAEQLLEAAKFVATESIIETDAQRTVLYLSLLASEITLKSLLEIAGKPVPEIIKKSHNLRQLLLDIDNCKITLEIAPGSFTTCSASRLRAVVVNQNYSNATVGAMLEIADQEASKYPNQVRYGSSLKHFPAHLMLEMGFAILHWAKIHRNSIRVVTPKVQSRKYEKENQNKAIDFIYKYRELLKSIRESPAGSEWLEIVSKSNLRNGYVLKKRNPELLMGAVEKIDEWLLNAGLQGSTKSAYQALPSGQRIHIIEIILNTPNPSGIQPATVSNFTNRDLDFYEGRRYGSVPSAYYGRWDNE